CQEEGAQLAVIGRAPSDLAGVVDPKSTPPSIIGNVKGGVGPAAIQKGVLVPVRFLKTSDDLTGIVDSCWKSVGCDRVEERGVNAGARVEKKTVRCGSGMIKSDDLTGCVNPSYGGTGRRLCRVYGGKKTIIAK